MKNLIPIITLAFIMMSCNSALDGEGTATATQEYAVEGFDSAEINCNCDVTFIPSETSKVVVESHQNLIDNLDIRSKGRNLVLKEKTSVGDYDLYNVLIYFTPELDEIELNKQARMRISGTLKANEFSLDLNDQSSVSESFIDIKNFDLDLSEQSSARMSGTVIKLDVNTSNESRAELSDLQAVEVEFSTKDNSHLSIYAMKDLSGTASNNSQVSYKGDPNKNTTEKDRAFIRQN
ncbi:MAG: hypothetical protein GX159_02365 [Flavobacteriaceae bacterium]|jgi:hypothetical protein|nr:hypothetical protein [Flavobacteriaceae bacterium]